MWETEWLNFRSRYFCWCQITSVASKSCSFSPFLYILACNSQSLLWMQANSSQFCEFCAEKALLQLFAVCTGNSSSICASLMRWEDQHRGALQEVATIPSSDQLGNAAMWLLSSNPLVSIQPFYHKEMALALVDLNYNCYKRRKRTEYGIQ